MLHPPQPEDPTHIGQDVLPKSYISRQSDVCGDELSREGAESAVPSDHWLSSAGCMWAGVM